MTQQASLTLSSQVTCHSAPVRVVNTALEVITRYKDRDTSIGIGWCRRLQCGYAIDPCKDPLLKRQFSSLAKILLGEEPVSKVIRWVNLVLLTSRFAYASLQAPQM